MYNKNIFKSLNKYSSIYVIYYINTKLLKYTYLSTFLQIEQMCIILNITEICFQCIVIFNNN